jgi:nucleoside-triphosphatase THEP1
LQRSGARMGRYWPGISATKTNASALSHLDLGFGATGMLADETGDGPQLGKYRVHLDDLDRIGAQAVDNALNSDLIIVDEIVPMELSCAGSSWRWRRPSPRLSPCRRCYTSDPGTFWPRIFTAVSR